MQNYRKKINSHPVGRVVITIIVMLISALAVAVAMNFFLIPHHIFTGGFNGISQMISFMIKKTLGIFISPGVFILLFTLIIGAIGWKLVGSKFTILSTINAALASLLMIILPEINVVHDTVIALVISGVIMGFGVGIAMRFGFSTGGMDIVAMIIQKRTGKSVGTISNTVNAVIIIIAGFMVGWQSALSTLISIYVTGLAMDAVFTNQQKVTAFIITRKPEPILSALQKDLVRGITVFDSTGGFSKRKSSTLMMVISRVELFEMQEIVLSIDPKAFINVLQTAEVKGLFLDQDRQIAVKTGKEKLEIEEENDA